MRKKRRSFSKTGKLLCLMLAVVLMIGAIPLYSAFASMETDESSAETESETSEPSAEVTPTVEKTPAQDPEPEEPAGPSESTEPEESGEPEDITYANSISGVLWIDINEDGTYDGGEQPLAYYPVYLYLEGDTDNTVQTAATDADGKYIFENISPGRYVVGIKAEENGTEYLLPLVGIWNDNKFSFTPDWSKVVSKPIDVAEDTIAEDIDAAMRMMPKTQPMDSDASISFSGISGTTATLNSTYVIDGTLVDGYFDIHNYATSMDTNPLTSTSTPVYITGATGITIGTGKLDGSTTSPSITIAGLTPGTAYSAAFTVQSSFGSATVVWGNFTTDYAVTEKFVGLDGAGFGMADNIVYVPANGTYTASGIPESYTSGGYTYIYKGYKTGSYAAGDTITSGTPSSLTITSNQNVYYVYAPGVTVTFDANGGTVTTPSAVFAPTDTFGTLPIPTRTGYDFSGWFNTSASTGGAQADSATVVGNLFSGSTGTLYARWTPKSYTMTVNYVGRDAVAVDTSTTSSAVYDSTFAPAQPSITGYAYVGWYLGAPSAGATVLITTPQISPVTDAGEITLVYGLDRGATGDDPTDPGTTGDGIEDVVVTREWYDTVENVNLYPPGEQSKKVVNVDNSFVESFTLIIGYDYKGFRIDGGALQTGSPSIAIAAGDTDFTITYEYERQDFMVTLNYVLRDDSAVPGTTPLACNAGFGTTYSPTASELQVASYVLVGWKVGLSGTLQSNTNPSITVPLGGTTIYLVYGRDSGKSGDIGGSGSETPNGKEDVDVTRKWEMTDGSPISGLPDEVQIWDIGDTFNIVHNSGALIPTTVDYQGYKLDTDLPTYPLHTGTPSIAIMLTGGNRTITYIYQSNIADLTISNTVTGAYGDMTKPFTYTVYFEDSTGTTLAGATFSYTGGIIAGSGATAPVNGTLTLDSSGEATVTLAHGQTITISGVSNSGKVRVVQTADTNYMASFIDSEVGTSESGADTTIRNMTSADRTFDFINTRSVVPSGVSTGSGGMVLLAAALALAASLIITAVCRRRARES